MDYPVSVGLHHERKCADTRGSFWTLAAMIIVAIFAIGFGVRACSIANDAEKVVEETAYQISAFMPY
ncbi:MAG: hypothetical protein LBC42_00210 [Puniceicoccales bacterium]|nr:hypothetical protein [Puniceicoccales bacterium]